MFIYLSSSSYADFVVDNGFGAVLANLDYITSSNLLFLWVARKSTLANDAGLS